MLRFYKNYLVLCTGSKYAERKIEESAKAASVHSFSKTLPGGYDMVLSKDAEYISQGERQPMKKNGKYAALYMSQFA